MKNIREEKGLTYGISFICFLTRSLGIQSDFDRSKSEKLRRVIDEILHEIRLLQTVPVGKDEMAVAAQLYVGRNGKNV